ncbi:hypothetical protein C3370_06155 [Leclercia sp. LSNIH7]|uniref:hypothetical protein n=1 Tax=unclassified Leclercia TaxID=2627398 RepID=UPI000CDD6E48|nr:MULTISPECIES: hypothetical protein [unclassified Leclercia]POU76519.1 hypothetical protein C3370_06155 [Leclercia sp. LSNIH7]
MMKRDTIEAVITEMARQQGHDLNGQEMLQIRTSVASSLAAKERYRQRKNAGPFQWKKPDKPWR